METEDDRDFTEEEVRQTLQSIDHKKATAEEGIGSKGAEYSPPKGNSPGPKIKKMGVQWAPKLKNWQDSRTQSEKDVASTPPPISVRRHLLLPILTAAAATVNPTSAPS